jgi:catalase
MQPLSLMMEKKKVESFIIPPTYFRKRDYSMADQTKATETKSIPLQVVGERQLW